MPDKKVDPSFVQFLIQALRQKSLQPDDPSIAGQNLMGKPNFFGGSQPPGQGVPGQPSPEELEQLQIRQQQERRRQMLQGGGQ